MKLLLLGSGGREHALAWKISQSPLVDKLFIAPGNAGTAMTGENIAVKADDFDGIKAVVLEKGIDMVVVGPEDPLVKGIYDYFKADEQLKGVMEHAEAGAVTYTAAMNEGERYIADHIKAAGYPLVLLMKDGFPPVGSEEEKKYKPGGMMSDICSQGRLLLLEAYPESYDDSRIVEMTEISLRDRAEKKGWRYEPLLHSTLRWRSIACNEMMRMLSERN
mgnify:CR=1 FL=1